MRRCGRVDPVIVPTPIARLGRSSPTVLPASAVSTARSVALVGDLRVLNLRPESNTETYQDAISAISD